MSLHQMGLSESCPLFLFTSIVLAVLLQLGSSIPHVAGSEHGRNETDRLALLAFKTEITRDPFGSLNSWNQSLHFCQWTGVTCGRRHQRVIMLNLDGRKLAGSISPHIGNLSFLRELWLVGKIPPELGRLAKLKGLYLGKNNLTGGLPSTFANLSYLEVLSVVDNGITGNIPDALGRLRNLKKLEFGANRFLGTIPSSIFNLSSIELFDVIMNQIQGSLPSSLGITLPNLQIFGVVPPLDKLRDLEKLGFFHNHLGTGEVDDLCFVDSLINATNLYLLDLSENHFGGVTYLPTLESFKGCSCCFLEDNKFYGEIPSSFGNLTFLTVLSLSENNLHGNIPSSIEKDQLLHQLTLDQNNLCGAIPKGVFSLSSLSFLTISHNNFSGSLPVEIGKLNNLELLDVSENMLVGNIPSSLGSCVKLTLLYLDGNQFWGILPSSLSSLRGLILMFLVYIRRFRTRTELPSFRIFGNSLVKLSYQSLLKATDGFSPSNLIGVGSFGSVYKGILDHGEKIVAVKVLNLQYHGASKTFVAECKALRSVKHRNLVKILTACSSVDYQGNDFKALVYEFMINGSLEECLHPNENKDDMHEESRNLNLLQRLNIAIDVASALDYLHHHCPEPIVHCDLKPSNVLLDNEMTGHVGDFGLAKFLQEATYVSSTNHSSSNGLRGSVGYAAPAKRPTDNNFNDNVSLHNFAKMALPEYIASIVDPTLFQRKEKGEASSSINDTGNHCSASSHKIQECLISILKVGIACSEDRARDRPVINDVVNQLDVIRNIFLGRGLHGGKTTGIAV
ncbi:leucine-rich repeat protein kinase family protein [Actinidia rufa]|uniref:non-specific serine/threonine protein kinase n=1 Tax=Actinidia rufa TaxID=165716 RepID=A0A7J0DF65_9ERIC|nr:leucine-rich repeat protein kinase family protein [Actinidia rufa]